MNELESIPQFGVLNDEQRALIRERMVLEQLAAGEHLYRQGEPAHALYLVKSGWVRLVTGEMAVLANLGQGSLLGDADMLLGRNYATGAEALRSVEAYGLSDEALADLIATDPDIGLKLSDMYGATVAPLVRYLVERHLRVIHGLDDLPDDVLVAVAKRLCFHSIKAGDILFASGQAPTALYLVDAGCITLGEPEGPSGDYGPGELLAERSLLLGQAHTLTARAAADSRLWELSAVDLDRLGTQYPDLRAALSRVLQSRLSPADQARAIAILQATPIFQGLPEDSLQELVGKLVWQMAPGGSRIFEANTPAETMYLVDSGSVELFDPHNEPLARMNAGGYFGEAGLAGGAAYKFAAVARGNTTLWALARTDVESVAAHHPAVRRALADYLAAEKASAAEHFAERHLRRLALFAGLSEEQLRDVAGRLSEEQFQPGQPMQQRGEPGEALYLIEQGRVSIQTRTSAGQVRTLANMGPGEFFGETALLTGEPHATDAVAQSEVSAWRLSRQDFEALLMQYPILGLNLSRALSYRLRQSNEQVAGAVATAPASSQPGSAAGAAAVVGAAALAVGAAPAAAGARPAPAKTVSGAAVAPVAPIRQAPRRVAVAPAKLTGIAAARAWFGGLQTTTKIELVVLTLLVLWLIIAVPLTLLRSSSANRSDQNAQSGKNSFIESAVLVALAANSDQPVDATATYTPWPTETPLPSPTPTATPVPTATNTPVPPTATALPTSTRVPTRVPPAAAPQPAAAQEPAAAVNAAAVAAPAPAPVAKAAAAKPGHQFTVKEMYHLTGCENGGNHNLFVVVQDSSGAPVDGIKLAIRPGDMSGAPDSPNGAFAILVSGEKGPGKAEFPMYKGGQYAVYPTNDPGSSSPADTDIAQNIGSVRDFNGNPWPYDHCDGGQANFPGHNSVRVTFVKNW